MRALIITSLCSARPAAVYSQFSSDDHVMINLARFNNHSLILGFFMDFRRISAIASMQALSHCWIFTTLDQNVHTT